MRGGSLIVCALAAVVSAGACDQSFEPIAKSELHWSVFGYLDASADTQWIRVMPVRPLKVTSPDSSGATVTLEDLGTSQVIPLRDSVFHFTHFTDPDLGSEGAFVHNFWTTQPIEPGATYRMSVVRGGEDPSETVVKIPDDYVVEVLLVQRARSGYPYTYGSADTLRVTGLKHLPFVAQVIPFQDGCGTGVDTVWYDGSPTGDGPYSIRIDKTAVPPRGNGYCGTPAAGRRELWLVASDSTWPVGAEYSAAGLGQSALESNITDAIGFVGGVLTKKIPYEACTFEQQGQAPGPTYCVLRYDQDAARASGTITETRCGDGPISSVAVQLTDIDQDPSEIRSDTTGLDGRFEIGALRPGMRYAMKVRAEPIPVYGSGEIDAYTLHYDTLTFAPGEQRPYDVALQRLTPCGQGS